VLYLWCELCRSVIFWDLGYIPLRRLVSFGWSVDPQLVVIVVFCSVCVCTIRPAVVLVVVRRGSVVCLCRFVALTWFGSSSVGRTNAVALEFAVVVGARRRWNHRYHPRHFCRPIFMLLLVLFIIHFLQITLR